ncbi:hypothetical protein [Aquiflexum balticum]|nr:hypothetical protein [Aquiflexum balticum]
MTTLLKIVFRNITMKKKKSLAPSKKINNYINFIKSSRVMELRMKKYNMIEKIMQLDEDDIEKLEAAFIEIFEEVSLEQYNKELDRADKAIDEGKFIEHHEAVKKIRSWREK